MSDCEKYSEMMSRMLDDALSEAEHAQLMEHIQTCSQCRLLYDAFSAVSDTLAEDLLPVPDTFSSDVMAKIQAQPPAGKKKGRVLRLRVTRWAAAAACAALVIFSAASAGLLGRPGALPVLQANDCAAADTALQDDCDSEDADTCNAPDVDTQPESPQSDADSEDADADAAPNRKPGNASSPSTGTASAGKNEISQPEQCSQNTGSGDAGPSASVLSVEAVNICIPEQLSSVGITTNLFTGESAVKLSISDTDRLADFRSMIADFNPADVDLSSVAPVQIVILTDSNMYEIHLLVYYLDGNVYIQFDNSSAFYQLSTDELDYAEFCNSIAKE